MIYTLQHYRVDATLDYRLAGSISWLKLGTFNCCIIKVLRNDYNVPKKSINRVNAN